MLHTYSTCVATLLQFFHSQPTPIAVCLHNTPFFPLWLYCCVSIRTYNVYSLQVRSAILAKLEPKYQNSSLRAMADSNSFLTRLRVGGGGGEGRGGGGAGSLPRAPPTGRERGGHYQRQQRLLNEARRAARLSHEQGPTTSIDCKWHRHWLHQDV